MVYITLTGLYIVRYLTCSIFIFIFEELSSATIQCYDSKFSIRLIIIVSHISFIHFAMFVMQHKGSYIILYNNVISCNTKYCGE